MHINNKDLYPTPPDLVVLMKSKIDFDNAIYILEPSAGLGNIAESFKKSRYRVSCIEIDPALRATLTGKKLKVIDSDFLQYSGQDFFDVIIMNPPFSAGEHHLLKAIDIMFNGQIVCLLNAETLKNPYSIQRRELVKRMSSLNAKIEYLTAPFSNAERKTFVDVALIYIDMRHKNKGSEMLRGCAIASNIAEGDIENYQEKSLVSGSPIAALVEMYNKTISVGMDVIKKYFEAAQYTRQYINLILDDDVHNGRYITSTREDIANRINEFISVVRRDYWCRVLDLEAVKKRMTEKKKKEFKEAIQLQSSYDFTEINIRNFLGNLIATYEDILSAAVSDIFDRLTHKHHWGSDGCDNIHYYNGWKSNEAHYINKKVVIPVLGVYGNAFRGFRGWALDYAAADYLRDIDIVMNYFDGVSQYKGIDQAISERFKEISSGDKPGKIESSYFFIQVYKKGTVHLTFKDESIRRRFNICAGKHKNWLPPTYGKKSYSEMTEEEKLIVKEFEGKDSYIKNIGLVGFKTQNQIKLLQHNEVMS